MFDKTQRHRYKSYYSSLIKTWKITGFNVFVETKGWAVLARTSL